jgi:translation initiation factor IF-1
MPKNTKGGNSHKKQKNSSAHPKIRRAVDIAKKAGEFEVYGRVLRPLGNRRMEIYCQIPDSKEYQTIVCRIRGVLRKRIVPDDYVLVQLFDFNINIKQGQIADVYTVDEVESLIVADLWDMTDFKPDVTGRPVDKAESSDEFEMTESEEESESEEEERDDDVI